MAVAAGGFFWSIPPKKNTERIRGSVNQYAAGRDPCGKRKHKMKRSEN